MNVSTRATTAAASENILSPIKAELVASSIATIDRMIPNGMKIARIANASAATPHKTPDDCISACRGVIGIGVL